jgi:YebC/PmpR family DNA-binding regulatory protein
VVYEEFVLEGYGPGGVAIMIEVATDNKNRSISDIKHIMTKNNGHFGEVGCVAWTFDQKGLITVPKDKIDEDTLMGEAMEAGADDILTDEDSDIYEVTTATRDLQSVKDYFTEKGVPFERAELTRIPKSEIDLTGKEAEQMLRLVEAIEDNDDVQKVYVNFNISQEELTKIEETLG